MNTPVNGRTQQAPPAGTRVATVLVVLAIGLWIHRGFAQVDGSLPYPQNWDESPIMEGAARVVQGGQLNPGLYAYPSLSVYIASAALAVGYVSLNGESRKRVPIDQLGRLESPYYEQPQAMAWVRKTWVLMLAGAWLALASIAQRLAGPWAMALCAWLTFGNTTAGLLAWNYVNVDIPLLLFAALTLQQLIGSAGSALLRDRVLVPAVLCGAAMACKYTAFVLLVPCAIAAWAWSERDRGRRLVLLVLCAFASFVVFCPFFVLDLPAFLQGLAYEHWHYKVRGHSGVDGDPGWGQLFGYLGFMLGEHGWPLCGFALAGALVLLRRKRLEALLLLVFALCWLGFLSRYKVFFVRNALPVSTLVPVFAAAGVCATVSALAAWCAQRPQRVLAARPRMLAVALCALAIALGVRGQAIADTYLHPADPRNRFVAWAARELGPHDRVLIPSALPIAPATYPERAQMVEVDFSKPENVRANLQPGPGESVYALIPHFSPRGGWVATRVRAQQAGVATLPRSRVVKRFPALPLIPVRKKDVCMDPGFDLVKLEAP